MRNESKVSSSLQFGQIKWESTKIYKQNKKFLKDWDGSNLWVCVRFCKVRHADSVSPHQIIIIRLIIIIIEKNTFNYYEKNEYNKLHYTATNLISIYFSTRMHSWKSNFLFRHGALQNKQISIMFLTCINHHAASAATAAADAETRDATDDE